VVDIMSPAQRSRVMSRIRGKNTIPERYIASLMRAAGLTFKRHDRTLPRVLLLGSKKHLRERLATWIVGVCGDGGQSGSLGNEVPFGEVAEDGTLHF
jgi:G:T-mismatch repair DNA endonuclease (very short patch repair protein)